MMEKREMKIKKLVKKKIRIRLTNCNNDNVYSLKTNKILYGYWLHNKLKIFRVKKRREENLSNATCLSSAERILLTAFGVPKNVEPIFMIALICLAHHPRPPPPPIGGGASTHFMKCRKYRTPIE